eukprot:TRINITY_DN15285_c0_g1_i1.p1 TRINITY_DN15285_c0_g1~~TRINITY_DN15285_c0_g1_i1.p1  ORF type:complete len:309 (-),score=39.96 TRINITY_DN15285_c0_g1_i1:44-970(-)
MSSSAAPAPTPVPPDMKSLAPPGDCPPPKAASPPGPEATALPRSPRILTSLPPLPPLTKCREQKGFRGADERRLEFTPCNAHHMIPFLDLMSTTGKSDIVRFFREILHEVEGVRGIDDYHMKIPSLKVFTVEIMYAHANKGPLAASPEACISCNMDAPIFDGMSSGETLLEEYGVPDRTRCSMDAQARQMFVITPFQHIERLSDLSDDNLFDFWHSAAVLLEKEKLDFSTMIVNHGTYRHLPHLHLKIHVSPGSHAVAVRRWSEARRGAFAKLQKRFPGRDEVCRFFSKKGYCRENARCRFKHVAKGH